MMLFVMDHKHPVVPCLICSGDHTGVVQKSVHCTIYCSREPGVAVTSPGMFLSVPGHTHLNQVVDSRVYFYSYISLQFSAVWGTSALLPPESH